MMISPISDTLTDIMDVVRAKREEGIEIGVTVYKNTPCALSRSAFTHSPTPPGIEASLPQTQYRFAVYTLPDVDVQIGDNVCVKRGTRQYIGTASDSFSYETHGIFVLNITEVQ